MMLDKLTDWWVANESSICRNSQMVEKYRVITKEIKVYQRKAHDMDTLVNALKDIVTIIHKLRQIDHRLTQELESVQKDFCKRWADSVRDRDIMEVRAGIPM